jgi:hypothetical protein
MFSIWFVSLPSLSCLTSPLSLSLSLLFSGNIDVQYLFLEEISIPENLATLIQDPFGNYVIQNALKYLPVELKGRFVDTLLQFIDLIKQMPWGLQIISKMCSDSNSILSPTVMIAPVLMPSPSMSSPTDMHLSPSTGL